MSCSVNVPLRAHVGILDGYAMRDIAKLQGVVRSTCACWERTCWSKAVRKGVTLTSSVPTSAKILFVGAPQAEIFSFKGLSRDKNGVAGRAKMSQMSG